MRKVLALLLMLGSASAAFGFDGNDSAFAHNNDAVVRWKTIVGNITVSNNDAVGESTPGPLLGARSAEGLASI